MVYAWLMILLVEEILHQLIGTLSHYLQHLYVPGGAGFLPSTVRWICCQVLVAFAKTNCHQGLFSPKSFQFS